MRATPIMATMVRCSTSVVIIPKVKISTWTQSVRAHACAISERSANTIGERSRKIIIPKAKSRTGTPATRTRAHTDAQTRSVSARANTIGERSRKTIIPKAQDAPHANAHTCARDHPSAIIPREPVVARAHGAAFIARARTNSARSRRIVPKEERSTLRAARPHTPTHAHARARTRTHAHARPRTRTVAITQR